MILKLLIHGLFIWCTLQQNNCLLIITTERFCHPVIQQMLFFPQALSEDWCCTFHKPNHSTPGWSPHSSDHRLLAVASLSYTSSFWGLHSFILTPIEQAHTRQIYLETMNTLGQAPHLKSTEVHKFIVSWKTVFFFSADSLPSFHWNKQSKVFLTPDTHTQVQRHVYACIRTALCEPKVPNNTQGWHLRIIIYFSL